MKTGVSSKRVGRERALLHFSMCVSETLVWRSSFLFYFLFRFEKERWSEKKKKKDVPDDKQGRAALICHNSARQISIIRMRLRK